MSIQQLSLVLVLLLVAAGSLAAVIKRWRLERERRRTEQGYQSHAVRNLSLLHTTYLFGILSLLSFVGAVLALLGYPIDK